MTKVMMKTIAGLGMANRSKQKGDTEERAVVNLHREQGYQAQRTLESGARGDGTIPTWDIDLIIRTMHGKTDYFKGECKIKKDGFKMIYDYLGDNDFLTIRADRKERLYVIPERMWLDYLNSL